MKTLMISAEDMQSFGKILPHPTTIVNGQSIAGGGVNLLKATPTMQHITLNGGSTQGGAVTNINLPDRNLVTMQYFLKHPTAQNALQQQLQQRQLIVTQSQLKQLTTKQPTSQHQQQQHQQQQQNYHAQHHQHHQHQHHHHPYYQQQQQTSQQQHNKQQQQQQQQLQFSTTVPAVLPVHALNQNSNFSAASSSTGGTASSHAPTQQSNTTAASFSPPGATANKRTTPASNNNNNSVSSTTNNNTNNGNNNNNARLVAANNGGATSNSGGTKKLKTEPVLSQFHQSERLAFANTHISWSEEHWKRVVFHDERKFNLDGPDGFSYYFHDLRNYERTLSQRPRGNSVFIYIVISAGGAIHLDVSTVKQKPESSIETILRERNNINLKLNLADFLVQDHNWTATSLPTAQEWLNAEGVKLQKWPAIAHDLNIMENIWGWLIREVYDCGRKFSRKDDLIFRIKEAWERLPLDLISNLYSTLPERITELYYTRGVYTNC